jgi:putative ABC transport system permease protein
MLRNFVIIALRNLLKYKIYSVINILGLAIGLASSIMIGVFAYHEWSYDKFHKKLNQIYLVYVDGKLSGKNIHQAVTSPLFGPELNKSIPEVENAVRIGRYGQWHVKNGQISFNEDKFIFTDSAFFDVFSFKIIRGNPKTALANAYSLILTRSTALRYFGTEDVIGKTLLIENDTIPFTITAITEDCPQNSHFHFELIGSIKYIQSRISFRWLNHNVYTYVALKKGVSQDNFNEKMKGIVDKYIYPMFKNFLKPDTVSREEFLKKFTYLSIPLRKIYLQSDLQYPIEPVSDKIYVYIFSLIAFIVLLIACFNFMNLTTALSANRTREIGMRKILGSSRTALVVQFFTETLVLSVIATLLSLIIVEILFPAFGKITEINLTINYFSNWKTIPALILLTLITGLISGIYPALYLSIIKPLDVLKGKVRLGTGNIRLRSILVVAQFSISIFILFATFTVNQQIKYFHTKKLGFDKNNILIIRRSDALKNNAEKFKLALAKIPNLEVSTISNAIPGREHDITVYRMGKDTTSASYFIYNEYIDTDYNKVFKVGLKEGRFFCKDSICDTVAAIVNEASVKMLKISNPIGKTIYQPVGNQNIGFKIIGVTENFHFQSLHNAVQPFIYLPARQNYEGYVAIRTTKHPDAFMMSEIKKIWAQCTDNFPFEHLLFDEDLHRHYLAETRTGKVMDVFSVLAIFVACLGLLGLISFTAAKRTREIGIRKTFGASQTKIVILLSGETLKLICWAAVVSFPVTYWIVNYWLTKFEYHIQINILTFIQTAMIILFLALATVFFQALKAAKTNPSDALKYE